MSGISPTVAGAIMSDALPLEFVTYRVRSELWRERAAGNPLKAAYHAVARRLGITPRRVRAYHHGEVDADEVRAQEMLSAMQSDAAWRREIEIIKGRIAVLGEVNAEDRHSNRQMAAGRVDTEGRQGGQEGRELGGDAVPLARVVTR